jgi:hypothetical protein
MTSIVQDQGVSYGPTAAQHALQSIGATTASNAITVTLDSTTLAFRSTTLTSGTPSVVTSSATVSLVIAATDSFGLVTAAGSQRIAILAINNAGTVELAATALYGGVSLDETGVITTAATATTSTAIKAANVRTGVAYRVVGFVDATFTTSTGWSAPALVQGVGGQALTAMSSLGYGQTWQNVAGSRAFSTTYYNTTGRPIQLSVTGASNNGFISCRLALTVNGVQIAQQGPNTGTAGGDSQANITHVIPPSASYQVGSTGSTTLNFWFELR